MTLCMSVCLLISYISETTCTNFTKFSAHLTVAIAQSSDDSAVRCILPVMWMTSCFCRQYWCQRHVKFFSSVFARRCHALWLCCHTQWQKIVLATKYAVYNCVVLDCYIIIAIHICYSHSFIIHLGEAVEFEDWRRIYIYVEWQCHHFMED